MPSAFGIKAGGFNLATERLEAAYKIALFERRFSDEGCYPAPSDLAKAISRGTGHQGRRGLNTRRLGRLNQVYVLKQGTNCEQLRMGLRAALAGSTSLTPGWEPSGSRAKGGDARTRSAAHRARPRDQELPAPQARHRRLGSHPLPRREVPDRRRQVTAPLTGGDGRACPQSCERLGAQRGWHISVVFVPGRVMARLPPRVT